MSRVDMAAQHRSGNSSRHKTKRAPRSGRPSEKKISEQLLHGLCSGHVDAGQLEVLAFHAALYGNVMPGMRGHFVLRVNGVHLLVSVVYEHILGAVLLD